MCFTAGLPIAVETLLYIATVPLLETGHGKALGLAIPCSRWR